MLLSKHLFISLIVIIVALSGKAWSAGDRAMFEADIAKIAQGLSRPNAIAFLAGLGELYCKVKKERGGGPLDVQIPIAEFHREHPESLRSADDTIAQDEAMNAARIYLCPD